MKNIAFIGTGVMGKSMVRNLIKNGYDVTVHTRTKQKAEELLEEGAKWAETVAECTSGKDATITIVGYPKDVEEVYFGEGGIIANARKNSYIIDMTTTSPKLAERIYAEGKNAGLNPLDAPVSGGDIGAKNATLAIMVGGEKESFLACLPIFQAMGNNIVLEGGAGAGQHVKMANQIAIAGTLAGVCEAIKYAEIMGVDKGVMLKTIASGAAQSWQLANNGAKIIEEDFSAGFYLKHFIKDLALAIGEAKSQNQNLPILEKVYEMCIELEKNGMGEEGNHILYRHYQKA